MRKLFGQYGFAILGFIIVGCIVALLLVPGSPVNMIKLYESHSDVKAPVKTDNAAVETVYSKERPTISFPGAGTIKKAGEAYDLEACFSAVCASDAAIDSVKVVTVTKDGEDENLIGIFNRASNFTFPETGVYLVRVKAVDTQKRIMSQVFQIPLN